jgi:O-antigen/teichoic acid export membrane protein
MIKAFFKDSIIYSISGILSRGISLLLLPVYTRIFGTADYGLLDYLVVMGSLVAVTVALEITQGMARYYASSKDEDEKKEYGSTTLLFTIIAYVLFLLIVFIFRFSITSLLLGPSINEWITVLAATSFVFNGIVYAIQNQLRWNLASMQNAKLSLVTTLGTIVFTFLFVVGLQLGVMGALMAQIIASILAVGIGYHWIRHSFVLRISGSKLKQMLRFSLPLVPSSLGVVAALYVDRMVVKQLLTMGDLGVFGVGYRIASIVGLLMMGFQSSLGPLIYAHHHEENTPQSLAYIFRIFVTLALLFYSFLSLFSVEIVTVIAPVAYRGAAAIVPPMVFGVLLWQMYIFAPGLNLAKKTGTVGVLNIAAAVLNLMLNYVFIPSLGIVGAGLATFLSSALIFMLYMYFSQLYYYVPHQWKPILLAVVSTNVIVYASFFVSVGFIAAIAIKTGALIVIAFLLMVCKLVTKEELNLFWKKITGVFKKERADTHN